MNAVISFLEYRFEWVMNAIISLLEYPITSFKHFLAQGIGCLATKWLDYHTWLLCWTAA